MYFFNMLRCHGLSESQHNTPIRLSIIAPSLSLLRREKNLLCWGLDAPRDVQ